MSFLKKLIGWKSKNQKQSKGQKLGGGSDAVDDNDDDGSDEQLLQGEIYEYDIIFHDTIIGCQLGRGLDQGCYVVGVTKESAAALNDVRISDKILAVDGNIVAEYDIVLSTLQAIGRPVTLKFLRNENGHKKHVIAARTSAKPPSGTSQSSASVPVSTNTSSSSGGSSFGSSFFSRSNSKASKGMTPDERQARRDMILRAAKDREQAWDKKVAGGRKAAQASDSKVDMNGRPIFDHSVAASIGSNNPETQRQVEVIRKAEEKQAKQLGYNPYKPHLSFSGNGPTASAATAPTNTTSTGPTNTNKGFPAPGAVPSPTLNSTQSPALTQSDFDDSEMAESVDDAFAQLLSIGNVDDPQSEEKVNSAISTIQKMLNNLQKNKQELKFRSIRLMNEAFQAKVVSVPGGLELMMAAGFVLVEAPVDGAAVAAVGAGVEEGELTLYLKHDMSQQSEAMLDYTIRRLHELQ